MFTGCPDSLVTPACYTRWPAAICQKQRQCGDACGRAGARSARRRWRSSQPATCPGWTSGLSWRLRRVLTRVRNMFGPLSPSRAYAHLLEGCSAPVYERSAARHETLSARQACGCACLGSLLSAAHVACAPCAMLKWRMPSCMRPRLHVAAVGHLDLIYTRVVTRREGFEFMNHSERAEHLALPMCGFERVAALILEPVSKGARIAHVVLWYLDVHSECMVKPLRATWRSTVSAWQSYCGLPSLCIASRHHA